VARQNGQTRPPHRRQPPLAASRAVATATRVAVVSRTCGVGTGAEEVANSLGARAAAASGGGGRVTEIGAGIQRRAAAYRSPAVDRRPFRASARAACGHAGSSGGSPPPMAGPLAVYCTSRRMAVGVRG
jgi:hypothetical protein